MYESDNPLPPGKRVVDLYLAALAVSKFTDGQVPGDDPTTALEAAMPGAYGSAPLY